ncbi:MAG TPA: hypothetical protein VNQ90_16250 [Chthoniobacteraceae bacterium]|nr:hypothetical protein [Chthoniobacteraceae bacterium]
MPPKPPSLRTEPPLCVDLDGTLIASDTLADSFCLMVRQNPLTALQAPFWLLRGWPRLKDEMVARTRLPVANLPYRPEVVRHLRREREKWREILLVTASAQRIAEDVAAETQLFTGVIGSAHGEGLRGAQKAQRLVQCFGAGGFDYLGDCRADLAVWARARKALVVGSERLARQARAVAEVETVFAVPAAGALTWLEALGVAGWPWLLLLLPAAFLFAAGAGSGPMAGLIAAVFCLGSAAFALLEGLMAIGSDRAAPSRRSRPFAGGRLPVLPGVLLFGVLLLVSAGLAPLLPGAWGFAFGGYAALGLAIAFRPDLRPRLTSARPEEKISPLPTP